MGQTYWSRRMCWRGLRDSRHCTSASPAALAVGSRSGEPWPTCGDCWGRWSARMGGSSHQEPVGSGDDCPGPWRPRCPLAGWPETRCTARRPSKRWAWTSTKCVAGPVGTATSPPCRGTGQALALLVHAFLAVTRFCRPNLGMPRIQTHPDVVRIEFHGTRSGVPAPTSLRRTSVNPTERSAMDAMLAHGRRSQ